MRIAVNTRFLLPGNLEGYGYFLSETLQRITRTHPEHQFIFLFDRPFDPRYLFAANVIPLVVGPPARHPLLWKWWYDWRVPAILRKYKADVFVSMDGFCSLRTKRPQCLVVHDLAFRHYPRFNKRSHRWYYKRYMPRFLAKAHSIVTVSEFSKKDIIEHYPVNPSRISVVYSGVKEIFRPLDEASKAAVKMKYTDGKQFFIYTGAIHPRKNLVNLLKAFSVLKKRQQTQMKLVLAGRLAWQYGSFMDSLKSYKYREDVIMTGYLEEAELARLVGAAYALVYPSLFEGFGVPVLEAMQAGVPVITSGGTAMEEIAQGAALLADPEDHHSIGEQMMRLYKDESLRDELVEKGKKVAAGYSWDRTANELWTSILSAATKAL